MAEGEPTPAAVQEPTAPAPAEQNPTQPTPAPVPAPQEGDQPLLTPEGNKPKEGGEADEPLLNAEQKKPAEAEGAPDKYETFTVPEGFQMDDARLNEATGLFKELNLSQGNAQKVIDAYCKMVKEQQTANENQLMEARKSWRSDIRSRSDFREQRALAEKGMRLLLTTDAQRKLFSTTCPWLQDAPELFDLFVTAGRLVAEDNMTHANQPVQPTETDINKARFPNL